MTRVRQIEEQVKKLTDQELSEFRAWFWPFDMAVWDRQMEAESLNGKLDKLTAEALEGYEAGRCQEL